MRRIALVLAAFAFASAIPLAGSALAAQQETYTPAALSAAQAADKPIVVDVAASWCNVCAAQKPIVQALLKEPKFKDLTLFHVDFDTQKALLRKLNVRQQSTFIVFKGKQEVGRSTGDTNKATIAQLFAKAG